MEKINNNSIKILENWSRKYPQVILWDCHIQFSSVQSLSRVRLFATPWTSACQAYLSITNSGVYPNSCPLNQWCHPTISSSLVPFSSCPLEKAMATHSSTLAWEIPWMEEPGRLQSMGSWRVRLDWAISLSLFTFMHWRRKWQATPVFLPGKSQRREHGGLPSVGSHRVGHNWRDLAAVASCPQSFPASESFEMSQLFASGGQNIGVSASTSVLSHHLDIKIS